MPDQRPLDEVDPARVGLPAGAAIRRGQMLSVGGRRGRVADLADVAGAVVVVLSDVAEPAGGAR